MANGLTYRRITCSQEQTQELGETLSSLLRAGDAVTLDGDLGAGKTHFVQGVARGLGIENAVTSPTFNILQSYEDGRIPLNHFDLYRLNDEGELEDIAFYETTEGVGVSFIEWAEKFPRAMPADYLEITITIDRDSDDEIEKGEQNTRRVIVAHAYGERPRRLLYMWAQDPEARLSKIMGK